jgi:hypothetical protein
MKSRFHPRSVRASVGVIPVTVVIIRHLCNCNSPVAEEMSRNRLSRWMAKSPRGGETEPWAPPGTQVTRRPANARSWSESGTPTLCYQKGAGITGALLLQPETNGRGMVLDRPLNRSKL